MKAPSQNIVDQDEVTIVSVNKSLLSMDYASMSARYPDGLVLTQIMLRTSKSQTTSKKATLGLRSQRSVCSPAI